MSNTSPTFSIDPTEFAGKRAFVTGGSKGTGEAIVRRLASAGAKALAARDLGHQHQVGQAGVVRKPLRLVFPNVAGHKRINVFAISGQHFSERLARFGVK
jgi:NAD(P)-dependent dehydrogenase (short-subunit alcohol dehydrogenase family)